MLRNKEYMISQRLLSNFNTIMKSLPRIISSRFFSTQKTVVPKICVVGAGPAGFYAAQHLAKNLPDAEIDILERLPVPFGLVRYGVAPDHPEVKNVINTFTKTAQNPRVRFIGNINLGQTITLQHLKDAYHIVLLTYGAEKDRKLGIPGEDLKNVISARSIVGWYNGLPWNANLEVDLSGPTAVVIGQGNVAIDVARILLTPVDLLKTTDITKHALETLMSSKIREVYLIGRRGPLQAAFTIKELREMLKLPNCSTRWNQEDFNDISTIVHTLPRPKKRITELMLSSVRQPENLKDKCFVPKFFRSPLEFLGAAKVTGIVLGVNILLGRDYTSQTAVLTKKKEEIDCDLVVRSIGYKSVQVDKTLPFDEGKGVVPNNIGKVENGIYTAGWLATGPTGVILSTMSNSFEIANHICKDLQTGDSLKLSKPGFELVKELLKRNNKRVVTWQGWQKIDKYEQEMGQKVGKPREKIIRIEEMLRIGGEFLGDKK